MDMQPEVLEYLETYGAGFDVLFQLPGCALAKAGTNVAEVNIGEEHHAIGVRAAFDDRESASEVVTRAPAEIHDEPDYLVARYLEITALESALQPRRRGRKPKPKPPTRGSRGRPMIWGPLATLCLKRLELGQAMLREKGEPVTNVRAYELALAKELPKLSLDDRKRLAKKLARRTADSPLAIA